jgi:hypothetical protein
MANSHSLCFGNNIFCLFPVIKAGDLPHSRREGWREPVAPPAAEGTTMASDPARGHLRGLDTEGHV